MTEGTVPPSNAGGPGKVIDLVFAALLTFTAGLLVLSVPAGVYAFFFTPLSSAGYNWMTDAHLFFWVGPAPAVLPFVLSIGVSFLGVTGIYVLMLAFSAFQGKGPLRAMVEGIRSGVASFFSSPFLVVLISIGFLVFTASIIDSVVAGTAPASDPLLSLASLANAPLIEEFGFRMMMIGVAVSLISLGGGTREALRALWRPSAALDGTVSKATVRAILAVLLAVSAVTFGVTHVLYGWTSGKFFEASYGGLVLGYVYIKYGFHVSVLTHWGVNYFGSAFAFFGQGVYGIPWDSTTAEFVLQRVVDFDLLYLFGLACFLVVVYVGIRRLVSSRSVNTEASPVQQEVKVTGVA
jgi:hypothetical protein